MKKFFLMTFIAMMLLAAIVIAAGEGQGGGQPDETGPADQGADNGQGATPVVTSAPGPSENSNSPNVDAIREQLELRQQAMEQEMQNMGADTQKAYRNQNQVRLTVQALHSLSDLTGGIGPQVREVAREFNNSVQATIRAEERIEQRSGFSRFFTGGDKEAAEEIEGEVTQNQARIQTLKQLKEECDCEAPVQAMLQEQIQTLEQEQARLQAMAQQEKDKKGLIGWLWK